MARIATRVYCNNVAGKNVFTTVTYRAVNYGELVATGEFDISGNYTNTKLVKRDDIAKKPDYADRYIVPATLIKNQYGNTPNRHLYYNGNELTSNYTTTQFSSNILGGTSNWINIRDGGCFIIGGGYPDDEYLLNNYVLGIPCYFQTRSGTSAAFMHANEGDICQQIIWDGYYITAWSSDYRDIVDHENTGFVTIWLTKTDNNNFGWNYTFDTEINYAWKTQVEPFKYNGFVKTLYINGIASEDEILFGSRPKDDYYEQYYAVDYKDPAVGTNYIWTSDIYVFKKNNW